MAISVQKIFGVPVATYEDFPLDYVPSCLIFIKGLDMETKEEKLKDGVKFDEGKLRFDLLPPHALEKLVEVYTYGARKYADRNWEKGMAWSRTFGAIMRHAWKFWKGEDYDKESGLHHMAHAAFNCLALVEYTKTKPEFDNRPKENYENKKT